MARLRVHAFSVSVDGYGAGPHQDLDNPLGVGGRVLHEWLFGTPAGGRTDADEEFVARATADVGAWILGRNMFGPVRGPWPDDAWRGWWGDDPPFHTPVFVLTHHARPPVRMAGGTTFHFVTAGIHAALEQATAAAGGQDVRLGGGVATVRQYLEARLVDELHVAVTPHLLGAGEHLWAGLDLPALGYRCVEHVPSPRATHLVCARET